MIKLPKKVKDILKTLTDNGFEAYTAGVCVRDSLLGEKPLDWDIVTGADLGKLRELFPEARVLSETFSLIRMTFEGDEEEEDLIIDIATFRNGSIRESSREGKTIFTERVEEDLLRRDFTVNAMADNGSGFQDPSNGRSDLNARLIRMIGNADEKIKEDPIRIMKALRLVSELDFDLTREVYEAISRNRELLRNVSMDRFRREFIGIMGGKAGGKALNMIIDMDMLKFVLGDQYAGRLTHREKTDLILLCQNMHKSKNIPERRLGAFYSVLSEKKGLASIEHMGFEGELKTHLEDVAMDLAAFHFCQTPESYKKFIYEHAPMERSDYLLNLQKAIRLIFEYDIETKIKSKMYMLDQFRMNNDPIFPEDLVIDANDLMEAGLFEKEEDAEKMIGMLIERAHIFPKVNNRKELLELAERYKKHKFAAWTRGVKWKR